MQCRNGPMANRIIASPTCAVPGVSAEPLANGRPLSVGDQRNRPLWHRRVQPLALGICLAAPAAISFALCQETSDAVRRRAFLRSAGRQPNRSSTFTSRDAERHGRLPASGSESGIAIRSCPDSCCEFTREGIDAHERQRRIRRPLLWYYSPMDSAWSLGHFENRGIVYDCMDELSQFTGAPKSAGGQRNAADGIRRRGIHRRI